MKAKAEIVKFLRESFAFGHKAVVTLTPANSVKTVGKNKQADENLCYSTVSAALRVRAFPEVPPQVGAVAGSSSSPCR
jgi:hypothetical protein